MSERFELRPPRREEAAGVASLVSSGWVDEISEAEIRRAWSAPDFDSERDARLADGAEGALAYADLEDLGGDHEKFWLFLVQRESGDRAAEALAAWGEKRARELAKEGAGRILSGGWTADTGVSATLRRRGWVLVRHSYRMVIDLEPAPPAPVWPDGVSVRRFRPGDEQRVYEVHQETFVDSWEHVRMGYDVWEHWYLSSDRFDPDLWFVAEANEVAAIALCSEHETEAGVGWVSILGVRRPWRRRGLGRALLLHAFSVFRDRGFTRATLGVDASSLTGANRLYEQVGMRVAARFDTYEKRL
jgi:mycothiol synthase